MSEGLEESHQLFGRVAEEYDAARPRYPEALYVALEEQSGMRLAGARVVDVGAGTGISTRGLLDRGARVAAVDRSDRMLSRLRARTACGALLADGNDLPFRDGAADLVTYAQSWHWLDPALSVAEAVRVTGPEGAVAAWWNTVDAGKADWLAAYQVRLAESCSGYVGPALPGWSMPPIAGVMAAAGLAVRETWIGWTRSVRLDDFLTDLRSRSYVARLNGHEVEELVNRERAEIGRVFADGRLTVPMRVYLATGRKSRPGGG